MKDTIISIGISLWIILMVMIGAKTLTKMDDDAEKEKRNETIEDSEKK